MLLLYGHVNFAIRFHHFSSHFSNSSFGFVQFVFLLFNILIIDFCWIAYLHIIFLMTAIGATTLAALYLRTSQAYYGLWWTTYRSFSWFGVRQFTTDNIETLRLVLLLNSRLFGKLFFIAVWGCCPAHAYEELLVLMPGSNRSTKLTFGAVTALQWSRFS